MPELPELSGIAEIAGIAGTTGKVDAEGRSQNCREQPELPGKLTQRAEAGTAGDYRESWRKGQKSELSGTTRTAGKAKAKGRRG